MPGCFAESKGMLLQMCVNMPRNSAELDAAARAGLLPTDRPSIRWHHAALLQKA